jgi:hypothetical protein
MQLFDWPGMTSRETPLERSNLLAPKNDLFQGFQIKAFKFKAFRQIPRSAAMQKYFSFFFSEIMFIYRCPALDPEGRFAIVMNVGCGMRWACRVAAWSPCGRTTRCDGEIVRS